MTIVGDAYGHDEDERKRKALRNERGLLAPS